MGREAAYERERSETSRGRNFLVIDEDRLESEWGITRWAPGEQNWIAILPPLDETKYIGVRAYIHRNIGPDQKSFLCLREHRRGVCAICEARASARVRGAEAEELRALNCFPPRYFFLVVDMRSAETEAKGVQWAELPSTVNDGILGLVKDPRTGQVTDIADLDHGKNLYFAKEGKGLQTRYRDFKLEDRKPIPEAILAQIEGMPDLDEFLLWPTEEEVRAEFEAGVPAQLAERTAPVVAQRGAPSRPEADDLPYGGDSGSDIAARVRQRVAAPAAPAVSAPVASAAPAVAVPAAPAVVAAVVQPPAAPRRRR